MCEQKLIAVENIGGFFDSEIFLHESCIYLNIYRDIVNSGIRCSQVYDSFYYKAGTDIDVNRLYAVRLRQYKEKYSYTFNYMTADDIANVMKRKQTKNTRRKQRVDSDIPHNDIDVSRVNHVAEKIEKILEQVVKSGIIGLSTANTISRDLHIDRTFTYRDQPTGFCYSRETETILEVLKSKIPLYKKALGIKEN